MARFNLKKPRREFELRKDVTIAPPVAVLGARSPEPGEPIPWEDLYKVEAAKVEELHVAKNELIDFGRQVSTLCLALAKMVHDSPAMDAYTFEDKVIIPKAIHERFVGASIEVGHTSQGDPFIRIIEAGRVQAPPSQ